MNADPIATRKQCRTFYLSLVRAGALPRRAVERTKEHAQRLGLPASEANETVLALLWDVDPEVAQEVDTNA
jgi:N-acyl-L-homoserine lactone synthetase